MKTKTLVIAIILACIGLFAVLIAACAGVFFLAYKNTDVALSPKIDALFAAIDNDTFSKTYLTETTPEFREAISKEKYEQIGLAVKARLGSLQSKTLMQFNASQFNAHSYMAVNYSASFQKGSGTIRAQFKSVDGEWRLVSFYVDSPEFLKDMATQKCPYCGAPNTATARFCSDCGKSIGEHDANKPPMTNSGMKTNDPTSRDANKSTSTRGRKQSNKHLPD